MPQNHPQPKPITTGSLMKWASFIAGLLAGTVSICLWVGGVAAEGQLTKQKLDDHITTVTADQKRQDEQAAESTSVLKALTANVNELNRKSDVLIEKVNTVEKKVDSIRK